jgi:hypothetical protein
MATKTDVLNEIALYTATNSRPCPMNYLTGKFGDEAADLVKQLKTDGAVIGKRGRTGGLLRCETIAEGEIDTDMPSSGKSSDLQNQFAALAEKLAQSAA